MSVDDTLPSTILDEFTALFASSWFLIVPSAISAFVSELFTTFELSTLLDARLAKTTPLSSISLESIVLSVIESPFSPQPIVRVPAIVAFQLVSIPKRRFVQYSSWVVALYQIPIPS